MTYPLRLAAAFSFLCLGLPAYAQGPDWSPCAEDAMIVFDASGSMSSGGWGQSPLHVAQRRIDLVRDALEEVLPSVTRFRRVGLMTYGPVETPELFNQCDNVELNLSPAPNAARPIMSSVAALMPAGGTPLTRAVQESAEVLDFRRKPGLIVLLTDGQDTCGGSPCRAGLELHAEAAQLTIHVIGLEVDSPTGSTEEPFSGVRCLAAQNGGLYLAPKSTDELADALERTLGCPMVSQMRARDSQSIAALLAEALRSMATKR